MVTCSRDEQRAVLERKSINSLVSSLSYLGKEVSIVFFDNDSHFDNGLKNLLGLDLRLHVFKASMNLGYWSALSWIIDNIQRSLNDSFSHIHFFESDLLIEPYFPVSQLASFMDYYPQVSMIRTQEFRVKQTWRYDKRFAILPSPILKRRSAVSMRNLVSGEKARFIQVEDFDRLYLSNLHAKVPGFHNFKKVTKVFYDLKSMRTFTETDFFKSYYSLGDTIGVLDRGFWYPMNDWKTNKETAASWGDKNYLQSIGYQPTRNSRIEEYKKGSVTNLR